MRSHRMSGEGSIDSFCPVTRAITLVTPQGKIVDRIECQINPRYGELKVVVWPEPNREGATIAIRLVRPDTARPNRGDIIGT